MKQQILDLLKKNKELATTTIHNKIEGSHYYQVQIALAELESEKLIIKELKGSYTYWRLKQ